MVPRTPGFFHYRRPYCEINDYLVVLAEKQKNDVLSDASDDVLLVWVAHWPVCNARGHPCV